MSYDTVVLPKFSPHGTIISAKEQFHNSYTFWAMRILIFSPVQIIISHPLGWIQPSALTVCISGGYSPQAIKECVELLTIFMYYGFCQLLLWLTIILILIPSDQKINFDLKPRAIAFNMLHHHTIVWRTTTENLTIG